MRLEGAQRLAIPEKNSCEYTFDETPSATPHTLAVSADEGLPGFGEIHREDRGLLSSHVAKVVWS